MLSHLEPVHYVLFLNISRPDFDDSNHIEGKGSSFKYLMLIYPSASFSDSDSPETSSSLCLVVLVDSMQMFNLQQLQSSPAHDDGTPLKEYLDDGFYLGDIARYAENRMKLLIEQVVILFVIPSLSAIILVILSGVNFLMIKMQNLELKTLLNLGLARPELLNGPVFFSRKQPQLQDLCWIPILI